METRRRQLRSVGVRAKTQGRTTWRPEAECLETRALMATMLPDIAMTSATTLDSRGVTVEYDIKNAPIIQPLTFGVYRSVDTTVDPGSVSVGTVTVNPGVGGTLDESGASAL